MLGASGSRSGGYIPFAASFAAFLAPRPFDFIRMAAVSQTNIRLVGTHAGVEIGQDGPPQKALEDLAAIRAVPLIDCRAFEPAPRQDAKYA